MYPAGFFLLTLCQHFRPIDTRRCIDPAQPSAVDVVEDVDHYGTCPRRLDQSGNRPVAAGVGGARALRGYKAIGWIIIDHP